MLLASIDLETTGLEPNEDQILEVAIIIDPDQTTPIEILPYFHCAVSHDRYEGGAFALAMNQTLLYYLATGGKQPEHVLTRGLTQDKLPIIPSYDLTGHIHGFLQNMLTLHGANEKARFTAVGKNVAGFDLPFLNQLDGMDLSKYLGHRVLDPGSMYVRQADSSPPNLMTCLTRSGVQKRICHRAWTDAAMTLDIVRAGMKMIDAAQGM